MKDQIRTRMGDGELVFLSAEEVMEDILAGTQDASQRAGIPGLTSRESDQLFEIIAEPSRVVSVPPGEEVIVTDDGCSMSQLNLKHLRYFWVVASNGTIARASELLHLTPQTISGQLKQLEETIGQALFDRVGRGLVLTEIGHIVLEYADEIFSIGAELSQVLRGQRSAGHSVLSVGVVNSLPKLIAERIIAPAIAEDSQVRIVCH